MFSPSEAAILEKIGKSGVSNDHARILRRLIGSLCLSYVDGKPKETSALTRHVATSGKIDEFEYRML